MLKRLRKTFLFFLAISILVAGFCGGMTIDKKDYQAQASLLDAIRAWVTINPLEVDVSAPAKVGINSVFKVTAKVTNKGEEKIKNVRGEIFLNEKLVLLKKNPIQKMGVIQGNKSKKISWTVRGIEEGDCVITTSITGELKENLISAEDSVLVKIKNYTENYRLRRWYQNIFNFFRRWFNGNK